MLVAPCPPGNEGARVQGDGRRGIPGPSPSYLGSEPSAGNSMAGGVVTASAPSPSASRSRAPELPPSIARRARAEAQPARPPADPAPPHSGPVAPATGSGSSPSRGGKRAQAPRAPLAGAGAAASSAPPVLQEERMGRCRAGALLRRRPGGLFLGRWPAGGGVWAWDARHARHARQARGDLNLRSRPPLRP